MKKRDVMETLEPCPIEVWRGSVAELFDAARRLASVLSASERARHDRFRFERDRSSFLVSHVALRLALAGRARCDPERLEFSTNEFGKPRLRDRTLARRLDFNLSHSGDRVAIARTDGSPVGVDVEVVRSATEPEELAKRFFSGDEARYVTEGARPCSIQERFLRVWTAKEAFIKQRGRGLSLPLDSFSIIEPFAERSAVRMKDGSRSSGSAHFFDCGPGCQGAVYSDAPDPVLKFRELRELFSD